LVYNKIWSKALGCINPDIFSYLILFERYFGKLATLAHASQSRINLSAMRQSVSPPQFTVFFGIREISWNYKI